MQWRRILPGLIDCHTHLVFAGDRADEFDAASPARSMPRSCNPAAASSRLCAPPARRMRRRPRVARPRLAALMAEGVTTVEIKSGYGLGRDTELRQLRVARRLAAELPVAVRTTLLAAHAVPPEFAGRRADYVRLVVEEILPAAAGLADAVDVFHDRLGFTTEETLWVAEAARRIGRPVKLHGDQHADVGSAALAARIGALSVDHLEQANAAGLAAMGAPAPSPCCCPVPATSCVKPAGRTSPPCARPGCGWRSPRI